MKYSVVIVEDEEIVREELSTNPYLLNLVLPLSVQLKMA